LSTEHYRFRGEGEEMQSISFRALAAGEGRRGTRAKGQVVRQKTKKKKRGAKGKVPKTVESSEVGKRKERRGTTILLREI